MSLQNNFAMLRPKYSSQLVNWYVPCFIPSPIQLQHEYHLNAQWFVVHFSTCGMIRESASSIVESRSGHTCRSPWYSSMQGFTPSDSVTLPLNNILRRLLKLLKKSLGISWIASLFFPQNPEAIHLYRYRRRCLQIYKL